MSGDVCNVETGRPLQEICDDANRLFAKVGRTDISWVVRNGRLVIDWAHRTEGPDDSSLMCEGWSDETEDEEDWGLPI